MPGADIESDHIPLRADIILRLSRPNEKTVRKTLEPKVLKDEERRSLYEEHLYEELESIRSINDTNEHWLKLKEAFTETNEIFLTNTGRRKRNK
ncbi:hypothetical protein HHI36_000271 [Cryptolaemus montrouzieri]|uniref:Uncharacterized protein n=1 Tax=Cryptolaemus montrouzieri TaxID=559131 RepID=A0ABD2P4Q1_9CUCU